MMLVLSCRPLTTPLYFDIKETQWPIIYSPDYNIGFMGLEKLHPFDAGKWGRVFEFLKGLYILHLSVHEHFDCCQICIILYFNGCK